MNHIELIDVNAAHPEFQFLIEQLDKYLFELYPPEEVFLVDFADQRNEKIEIVMAHLNGKPVGCGAIKELEGYEKAAELKRFFVMKDYRNQGIAGIILKHLEDKARSNQYKVMKLETGDGQVEAIGFYKKNGYTEIDRFGEYVDCPSSVCMEKIL